jgi:serine/threonine protein phosphatase 1
MLRQFLGRAKQSAPPRIDPATRLYAVGDIHGCDDLLAAMHDLIWNDARGHDAVRKLVVYLGDYVDRGPASCAVIGRLLDETLPGFEAVHLLGNHEDGMLQFLIDARIGPHWLAYGGAATLRSYGVEPPQTDRDLPLVQEELRARLPARHLAFLRRLRLSHVEGDYLFVHAGIRPGIALDDQRPEDLLWIREEFLQSTRDFGKIVVHGHTIVDEPERRANRIGIDTGAFASGILTALVLQGEQVGFLQTGN